jgi:putative RNA 2'-phosphotransferase
MNTSKEVANFLSHMLAHRPDTVRMRFDEDGWTSVDELIAAMDSTGKQLDRAAIESAVAADGARQLSLSADGQRIRAQAGAVTDDTADDEADGPPSYLYYPTSTRLLGAIHASGLRSRAQHLLHLFDDPETANSLAPSLAERVIILVQAGSMAERGYAFQRSENGVWLTETVPPEFLL